MMKLQHSELQSDSKQINYLTNVEHASQVRLKTLQLMAHKKTKEELEDKLNQLKVLKQKEQTLKSYRS